MGGGYLRSHLLGALSSSPAHLLLCLCGDQHSGIVRLFEARFEVVYRRVAADLTYLLTVCRPTHRHTSNLTYLPTYEQPATYVNLRDALLQKPLPQLEGGVGGDGACVAVVVGPAYLVRVRVRGLGLGG